MALPGGEAVAALFGTFVVATVFHVLTVHLAATYVVGDVSISRALLVGPIPAAILVFGSVAWLPVAVAVAVPADFLAIRWSYELENRIGAFVTLAHVVISVLLAVSLLGLLTSLGVVAV